MPCQYRGTTPCMHCGTWGRQSFAASLVLFAFPALLDQIANIVLKESVRKPQSISLSDIMPAKHIASSNKNGFGKHAFWI